MGQKGKHQHVRHPKGSSKVMKDAILNGPKGGPHKDKRDKRGHNPSKEELEDFFTNEWDGKSP